MTHLSKKTIVFSKSSMDELDRDYDEIAPNRGASGWQQDDGTESGDEQQDWRLLAAYSGAKYVLQ